MREACSRCGETGNMGPLGFCRSCWYIESSNACCVRCGRAAPEQGSALCARCRAKADGIAAEIVEQAGPATELRLRRRADEVAVRFYRDKLALVLARMRREIANSRRIGRSPLVQREAKVMFDAEARTWSNAAALVRFADRRGIHPTLRTMLRDRGETAEEGARNP